MQMMPETFKAYSREVLGYIAKPSRINAQFIAATKIKQWLDEGSTTALVALKWNGGEAAKKCSSGINRFKVAYDSCDYINKVLANF